MNKILIINGPNLNLLGTREPDLYGTDTLDDVMARCQKTVSALKIDHMQSNHEGVLIDKIHEARGTYDGIIINAGAFSHTSIAIFDALNAYEGYVIEVHLSNIYSRESFRHHSYITTRANGAIVGLGASGYIFAAQKMSEWLG
ncbi:MAG: type II 3-dehydroquinate dehydratase [Alphaproteobacteria bacterium]|nr:type II 3-dehydroquinate dehydratase [Alphaproteobacteria bacterium]